MEHLNPNLETPSTEPRPCVGIHWPDGEEREFPPVHWMHAAVGHGAFRVVPNRKSFRNVAALLTHLGVRLYRAGGRTAVEGLPGYDHLDRATADALHGLAVRHGFHCERQWLRRALELVACDTTAALAARAA